MVSTARKKSKHDLCLLFSSGGNEAEESLTPRRIRGYRRSSFSGLPYPARYAGTPVILLFQTDGRSLVGGIFSDARSGFLISRIEIQILHKRFTFFVKDLYWLVCCDIIQKRLFESPVFVLNNQ